MLRYIAHALVFESGEILRITGNPKIRNEMPNPRNTACITSRASRKGIWAAVGAGPPGAGGQIMGFSKKAGTAMIKVSTTTATQVLLRVVLRACVVACTDIYLRPPFLLCGAGLVKPRLCSYTSTA